MECPSCKGTAVYHRQQLAYRATPAWLTDEDDVDYETTEKNETFKGTEVSRKSVASLIVKLIDSPKRSVGSNLGVNKPTADADKPSFL